MAVPPASAASRASRRHGNASRSGGSNVQRADLGEVERRAPARRPARDGAARRRSGRACRDARGARASRRRTARPARARSTAGGRRRRSGRTGVPNSQCASITSRPLFISVAESIVIFPPIAHVGCCSACSTVTPSSSAAERPRNGPPDAVIVSRSTVPAPLAGDQLVQRGVLGVDRDQLGAGRLGERHHELAAHDERLLVGQRDVDALGERDDRRAQPRRADDRVEHEVGAGLGDQPHEPLRARRAPRRRSRPPPRARRRRGRSARSGARRARAPARSAPRASARRTGRRARTPRERARRRRAPGCRSSRSSRGSGAASYRRPSVARGSFGVAKPGIQAKARPAAPAGAEPQPDDSERDQRLSRSTPGRRRTSGR